MPYDFDWKMLIPALKFVRKALWMFISIAALSEMTHIFTYDLHNALDIKDQIMLIGRAVIAGSISKLMFFNLDSDPNRKFFSFKIPNNPIVILSLYVGIFTGCQARR